MTTTDKVLKALDEASDVLDEILDNGVSTEAIEAYNRIARRLRRVIRRELRKYTGPQSFSPVVRKWATLAKILIDTARAMILVRRSS